MELNSLLGGGANVCLVEQLARTCDLLLGQQRLALVQRRQLTTLALVKRVQSRDHQEGLFAFENIATNRLTQLSLSAVAIQQIILQLERQTQLIGKARDVVEILVRRTTDHCSHTCRTRQQNGRFEVNHLDILLDRHLIARLEIHIILLTLKDLHCRRIEDIEQTRQQLRRSLFEQLIGIDDHRITRQNCDILVPLAEHRGLAATNRSIVHNIVVEQREVVEKLDSCRAGHSTLDRVREDSIREQCQHRTQALATLLHRVADRGVELCGFAFEFRLGEIVLDALQQRRK